MSPLITRTCCANDGDAKTSEVAIKTVLSITRTPSVLIDPRHQQESSLIGSYLCRGDTLREGEEPHAPAMERMRSRPIPVYVRPPIYVAPPPA
jgi:hypothetical protein